MVLFPQSINVYIHKVKGTETLGLCPRGHRQIGALRLQAGCQCCTIIEKSGVSLVKSFDSTCEQYRGKVLQTCSTTSKLFLLATVVKPSS